MSERVRNGHKYYRYTVWDKSLKKYRYLERKEPLKDFYKRPRINYYKLTDGQLEALFEHFSEGSTAFIPLHFIYIYKLDPIKVYNLTFTDCNTMNLTNETRRILLRHKQRISDFARIYNYDEFNDYICINFKTGKKLSHYQYDYVKKWIRRKFLPLNDNSVACLKEE